MTSFIPVRYGKKIVSKYVTYGITEISGKFSKTSIDPIGKYSLHTEYSCDNRRDDTTLIEIYPELKASSGKLQNLWYNNVWAEQFASFIQDLVGENDAPEVIEIHPPYRSYCGSTDEFLDRFEIFEDKIRETFPKVTITLENRYIHRPFESRFLMMTLDDIIKMTRTIQNRDSNLKLTIDYGQLFTSEDYDKSDIPVDDFISKHSKLEPYKKSISSIHLWGAAMIKGAYRAHSGNLDCNMSPDNKRLFLDMIREFYDDGMTRYLVPEINFHKICIDDILKDCLDNGIKLV